MAKFPLGTVVATLNLLERVDNEGHLGETTLTDLIRRHSEGDWGDVVEEDRLTNEEGLVDGNRLHSVYRLSGDLTVWVITEWDRSITTALLPKDY